MFGLTEASAASQSPQVIEAIIPTFVVPFALTGAILASIATAVAGWFGVKLKIDGPARLLELLLKPKVIMVSALVTAAGLGGYKLYEWGKHRSRPLAWVEFRNGRVTAPSDRVYPDNWARNQRIGAGHGGAISASTRDSGGAVPPPPSLHLAWEAKLPTAAFRGLSLSGASAFAGGMDGYIYELDRATGATVRRFYIGHPSVPLPLVHKGTLFAGEGEHHTHHARVYAFDLKTGRVRGAIETKGHTEGDLVIAERGDRALLFIPSGADGLYAADAETLEVLWHAPIAHFDSGVTVEDDRVYFTTGVEKGSEKTFPVLYALNIATGEVAWKADLAASGWGRPILFGDKVCVGLGEIYFERRYGQFACYKAADGQAVSAANFEGPLFNSPLKASSDDVIVADFNGTVCRFDVAAQKREWCQAVTAGGRFYPAPALDGSELVVVPAEDRLALLDARDGREVAAWKPAEGQAPWSKAYGGVTIAEDGWYLIDKTGVTRKFTRQ